MIEKCHVISFHSANTHVKRSPFAPMGEQTVPLAWTGKQWAPFELESGSTLILHRNNWTTMAEEDSTKIGISHRPKKGVN